MQSQQDETTTLFYLDRYETLQPPIPPFHTGTKFINRGEVWLLAILRRSTCTVPRVHHFTIAQALCCVERCFIVPIILVQWPYLIEQEQPTRTTVRYSQCCTQARRFISKMHIIFQYKLVGGWYEQLNNYLSYRCLGVLYDILWSANNYALPWLTWYDMDNCIKRHLHTELLNQA